MFCSQSFHTYFHQSKSVQQKCLDSKSHIPGRRASHHYPLKLHREACAMCSALSLFYMLFLLVRLLIWYCHFGVFMICSTLLMFWTCLFVRAIAGRSNFRTLSGHCPNIVRTFSVLFSMFWLSSNKLKMSNTEFGNTQKNVFRRKRSTNMFCIYPNISGTFADNGHEQSQTPCSWNITGLCWPSSPKIRHHLALPNQLPQDASVES